MTLRISNVLSVFIIMTCFYIGDAKSNDLNNELSKIANVADEISSKITIEHLLSHRSGFEDIFIAQYRENQLAFDTLDKKLALLKNRPLLFESGSEQRYSNYGYVVLGEILEKITNSSYEQLLNKSIFERINLKNTNLKVESSAKGQSTRYAYIYDSSIKMLV